MHTYMHQHLYVYTCMYMLEQTYIFKYTYIYTYTYEDDDVYIRLQYGKGFHNLVYMSYVKHINPASKA
jgi:hypothetical protein